jgi:hypothetical protein
VLPAATILARYALALVSAVRLRVDEEGMVSAVTQAASRTFTTNQPGDTGARPEPTSSSLACGPSVVTA